MLFRKLQTCLFPKQAVLNRLYNTLPEGEGGGGSGEPEGSPAPEEDDFQLPDKFKADSEKESLKKAVTSYQELEKELGKKGNSAQEIADIKNTLNELRSVIESKKEDGERGDEYLKQQKELGKSLGFVTRDELESAKEQGRREAELDRINETLQEKYNGKDGRPVYDRQAMTDFAKEKGYTNLHPEIVYKLMHEKEIDDWKVKQALKGNRSPSVPEGGRKPTKPNENEPNVSKMSDEERIAHMTERAKSYLGE